jgi:outer membrane immunogenic protein
MKTVKFGVVAFGAALAMPALGADLPRGAPAYKAPPPAPVVHNWTGCYVGGHVGYGWSSFRDRELPSRVSPINIPGVPGDETGEPIVFGYSGQYDTDGFLGGGQIGCDVQYGQSWVFGLVADVSWTDQKRSSGDFFILPNTFPDTDSGPESASVKLQYFGTARGRVGFTSGNWLFYGTGGLAWARAQMTVAGEVAIAGTPQPPFSVTDTTNHLGWAAGLGVEWMITPSWTIGLEYLHLDLGEANYRFGTVFPNTTSLLALSPGTSVSLDSDLVRLNLNYRFGAGPWIR